MKQEHRTAPPSAPAVVLDTNVILDAWVFENEDSIEVLRAVGTRSLRWVATCEMREELFHVVTRGLGSKWPILWTSLQDQWHLLAAECMVDSFKPAHWPRCTDPDDQKFIDLALAQKARWLISRDRAVLKTASRCAQLGLTVVDPKRWRSAWVALQNSGL